MSRHALLTGATGFVGTHLTRLLTAEGWAVRALVRRTSDVTVLESVGAEIFVGGLNDEAAIRGAASGADVVFHLAAATFARSEAEFERANVAGTRSVMDAVLAAEPRPRRVVYLSSYAACGPAVNGRPRTVQDTPQPLTAYGRSKLGGERVLDTLNEQGIEVVVLRAPAVYGPGDRALLSYFRLVRWGVAPVPSGETRRLHLIYGPDLARALVRSADVKPGTYAVADPRVHRWADVVGVIGRSMGRRPLRLPLPTSLVKTAAALSEGVGALRGRMPPFNREKAREMLADAWICDLTGSEEILPRGEATPVEAGIASTIQWYESQGWL
jgi:nucleoside-diphosphate-sugar epimerase